VGVLSIFAVTSYAIFYHQYSVSLFNVDWGFVFGGQNAPMLIALYYPFYLILVAGSVFIAVGILEWLRLPPLLFRPYVPSPPSPSKPKRSGVPEVISDRTAVTQSISAPSATANTEMEVTRVRPLGVTVLGAYYSVSGVASLAIIPSTLMINGALGQLSGLPDLTGMIFYLWGLTALSFVLPMIFGYGLLSGRNWACAIVRALSIIGAIGALITVALVAMTIVPALSLASEFNTSGGLVEMIYGFLILASIIGIILPCAIFWYLGRQHVRHYFVDSRTNPVS